MLTVRAGFIIVATVLTCALVVSPPSSGAGLLRASAPTRDGALRLTIRTDRQEYRIGDPILISVSVRNETSEKLGILVQPPCLAVGLEVRDALGNLVPKATPTCGGRLNGTRNVIEPHATQQLRTVVKNGLSDWSDLLTFGYALSQPGTYTLTAIPTLTVFQQDSPQANSAFNTAQVPQSNILTIVIK